MQEEKEKRVFLPPHTLTPIEEEYVASLSPELKKLHQIAVEALGSSYFVKSTHGFRKWLAAASKK